MASGQHLNFKIRWVFPDVTGSIVTSPEERPHIIGRDASCGTSLRGSEVSRQHAELRQRGPLWLLRDLDSKNGIFVNGERVEQAVLNSGDVVRIGEWLGLAGLVPAGVDTTFRKLGAGLSGGFELATLVEHARLASQSDLCVVVVGETGTGKERVAELLHELSGRAGPFVAVNCASYSADLAAAELFGHRQGAFTGASKARAGHVLSAGGGTLFLDEVADLPLAVQPQLLRVLEQREVLRVGESKPEPVDVKFVCATQVPLAKLVADGRFRSDLRARLEGIVLTLPPLRARRADIPGLLQQFLCDHRGTRVPTIETRLVERLLLHDWPLNVRELYLLVRRMLTLFPNAATLCINDVEALLTDVEAERGSASGASLRRESRLYPPEDIEALKVALDRHNGNLTRAAEELRITRQKAYRMLETTKAKPGS